MSAKAHGQIRRSQAITTWGPGALIDLPRDAAIVGGLGGWPHTSQLDEIFDARLSAKIAFVQGRAAPPRLFTPPPGETAPNEPTRGVDVWRFPLWALVREPPKPGQDARSRRLVPRKALDERSRFDGQGVIPTRFVRACSRGHIDDLDWRAFVHRGKKVCTKQLWLDELGTGGDLADLTVRCVCGDRRPLTDAAEQDGQPLGLCDGKRPWIGGWAFETCGQPMRLLIRTAANAYFPQVLSALSLPEHEDPLRAAVAGQWSTLEHATSATLPAFRSIPTVGAAIAVYDDDAVLAQVVAIKNGDAVDERPVKEAELDALLAQEEGFDDDLPVDPDFHVRRLPDRLWRTSKRSDGLERVLQLHRMREVLALLAFTRFESITPDINGDYDLEETSSGRVRPAPLAEEPDWLPAVENRGEGVFIGLRSSTVADWVARPAVATRIDELASGHRHWAEDRKSGRDFPGGPYILLHTLAHLLMQSLAMQCGYPATSIRERIYADAANGRYGLLLYTASPDAEGTLGGLVQQARHIEGHVATALRGGALCSNDPVCAQHSPAEAMEHRWLHGAACHGCALVAETSCEMRNDYLDRALVVPTLAVPGAAYFAAEA